MTGAEAAREGAPISFAKWAAQVEEAFQGLSRVIPEREDVFLELGERLSEIARASMALTESANAVAELAADSDTGHSAEKLSAELAGLANDAWGNAGQDGMAQLDRILQLMRDLDELMGSFKRIVKSLQMLGISTRIESARLGGKGIGFSTLADDVEKLAGNITNQSEEIRTEAVALKTLVIEARVRSGEILASQSGCSEEIFSSIGENLQTLNAVMSNAREVSRGLPERTREIGRGVGEIVSSVQFHDIVRQQIEHVVEALSEAHALIEDTEPAFADAPEIQDLIGFLADICTLQTSQVQHAAMNFTGAVARLRQGLFTVAENVRGIAEDTDRSVSRGSGALDGNVIGSIRNGIVGVLDSVREYAGRTESLGGIMNGVAGTIGQMISLVSGIEDIGAEIELIALNASIKAAHTGDEGRALGVLAQAIQRLSVEAREQTAKVSSSLLGIADSAAALQSNAAAAMSNSSQEDMGGLLGEFTDDLERMNSELSSLLGRVAQEGRDLRNLLADLADSLEFRLDVADVFKAFENDLRCVAEEAREILPQDADVNRSERLQILLARYTMEAERDVHRLAFGLAADENSGDSAVDDYDGVELFGDDESIGGADGHGPGEDELGDNVELF